MRAAALRVAPIEEGIRLWKDAGCYRMVQDVTGSYRMLQDVLLSA